MQKMCNDNLMQFGLFVWFLGPPLKLADNGTLGEIAEESETEEGEYITTYSTFFAWKLIQTKRKWRPP